MLNSGNIRLCFLLIVVLLPAAQLQAQELTAEQNPPQQGVRVIEVEPHGHADRAGIQVMDLLTRYGEFTVTDYSTYFKARDVHLKQPDKKVQLELWRGRTRFTVNVFPNWLGMDINEFSPVAYQLDAALKALALDQQIPDYKRDVEFKDHFQRESTEQKLAKAKAMIDDAEAQGTMTKFIEVSRIYKEALPEDYERNKLLTDAVGALALATSGKDELARAVVARWKEKDRVEGRLRDYWRKYSGGAKVIDNWFRLSAN